MRDLPGYEARSAGTQPQARIAVEEGHIGWADLIFVMEKSLLAKLRAKFPASIANKRVITLQIPDEYEFMDPALVEELLAKLSPYVSLGQ